MPFVVELNVGLRAGDILNLKIKDVFQNNRVMDQVAMNDEKTDKRREFELNKSSKEAISLYINAFFHQSESYYYYILLMDVL